MKFLKHRGAHQPETASALQLDIAEVDRETREEYMHDLACGLISDLEGQGDAVVAVEVVFVRPGGTLGVTGREPWSRTEVNQWMGA